MRTGVEITAQTNDGHIITQNVSHFKRINKPDDDTDEEHFEYQQNSRNDNQQRVGSKITGMTRRSNRIRRPPGYKRLLIDCF